MKLPWHISSFWIAVAAAAFTLLRTPKSERSSGNFRWRVTLFGVAVTASIWMDILGF
jgi:hypothetical protein